MWFELTIALRHLLSRKIRSGLISIITLITILGVVVGVTALIAVIAVMDGAQEDYLTRLINQQAHLQVWDSYGRRIPDYQKTIDIVRKNPEVVGAAPLLKTYVLLKRDKNMQGLRDSRPGMVVGIDPELQKTVTDMGDTKDPDGKNGAKTKVQGKAVPGKDEAVVGSELAKVLRDTRTGFSLALGDELVVVTGSTGETATVRIMTKTYVLKVVGIFDSGVYEVDSSTVYVDMETAQDITLEKPGSCDDIQVRLRDPYMADATTVTLTNAIIAGTPKDKDYVPAIRTWGRMNPALFRALKLEKAIMFIILLLVVLVAGLNLAGTLILVTMEKTREIGILRAMGVSRQSVSRIFVMEGALIGVVGTIVGDILGLALCMFLKYALPKLWPDLIPDAVYGLDRLPVLVKAVTVATISGSAVAVCLVASLIPAYRAARLNVVEALRYE